MNKIHPLASVSPKAILGDNIEIGPYAFIDDNVEIGDGCKIYPHAVIFPYVKMGKNCEVYPSAVVGAVPQDLKFEGEVTYVEIGDNVTIRECVTINRGTKASGKGVTKVGSNTLLMSYVHVAHDCEIGNHCILVSYVGVAGETQVDDWAIVGGGSKAHQFSRIGCYAGVNIVGLRRRGFSADVVRNIKDIYDTIYFQGYNITDGCAKVEQGFPDSEEKSTILNFIRTSKRGIIRANTSSEKGDID